MAWYVSGQVGPSMFSQKNPLFIKYAAPQQAGSSSDLLIISLSSKSASVKLVNHNRVNNLLRANMLRKSSTRVACISNTRNKTIIFPYNLFCINGYSNAKLLKIIEWKS